MAVEGSDVAWCSGPVVSGLSGLVHRAEVRESGRGAGSLGPVVRGSRIEVAGSGFALSVPDTWYALDLTHPDLIETMGGFDEVIAEAAPSVEAALDGFAARGLVLLAVSSGSSEGYLDPQQCVVEMGPDPDPFDTYMGTDLYFITQSDELVGTADQDYIELPAGRAGRVDFVTGNQEGSDISNTRFHIVDSGQPYLLACEGAEPDTEAWLAIAESLEFLPTES